MKLPLFIRRIIALVKVFRHKEYGGLLANLEERRV